jgi:plasmid stabilization system protein ParE
MTLNGPDWALSSPYESTPFVERIAQNPLQFPEIGSGVRRALLQRFPYALYFIVAASPVLIAVLHQRRHPERLKQRL